MKYEYTTSQWDKLKNSIEYFNEGDLIEVFNSRTGATDKYVIERKLVATRAKRWDEKLKN